MSENSIAKSTLRLATGCSFALLIALGSGAALAHGGGNHSNDNHNGNGSHHSSGLGKWSDKGMHDRRHHRHHKKTASHGPLHGAGSSHNPIVYHPVHGPGSSHNPIVVPVTVVRDHRTPPPRYHHYPCNKFTDHGCGPVRDHRTPPAPQCLGNLC